MRRLALCAMLCMAGVLSSGCDLDDLESIEPVLRVLDRLHAHDILAVREINLFPIVGR